MEESGTIVIDLGCKSYGGADDSIMPLVRRYEPQLLLGFDPQIEVEGITPFTYSPNSLTNLSTTVVLSKKAAWMYDGNVRFCGDGVCAGIDGPGDGKLIPCFDLASLVRALPDDARTIIKVDIEGAEYPLLSWLERGDAFYKLDEILVEWHTGEYTRGHNTSKGRAYYEEKYPDKFKLWHDPLHKRCCRA
jgi:hypothetical protein